MSLKDKIAARGIPELFVNSKVTSEEDFQAWREKTKILLQEQEYEKGKKYLQSNRKITLFKEEIEPIPGLRMRCIGGHSVGSCIVELGNTVIAGDECYTRRNLEERIPTATSVNPEKSKAFIETYSDPRYRVLLCHEEPILSHFLCKVP